MDKVARLPAEQRRDLFSETAGKMNLGPGLLEKDFWICWTNTQTPLLDPRFRIAPPFKGKSTQKMPQPKIQSSH